MGNQAFGGKKGSKAPKNTAVKANWIKLSDKEKQGVTAYAKQFISPEKIFLIKNFLSIVFPILSNDIHKNLFTFLNSYYSRVNSKRQLTENSRLEIVDLLTLTQILLKSPMDYDENIYYHKKIVLILYDMANGEILFHEKNKDNLNIETLLKIFNFAIFCYFKKYAKHSSKLKMSPEETFTDEMNKDIKKFLICNIFNSYEMKEELSSKNITVDLLNDFIDNKVPAIEGFIKNYISTYLLNLENDITNEHMTCFPLFNDPPSTLTTYKFFFYCLSNTNISSKPYAFKLYDCKTNGYNLSNLVYSFLGFTGPIIILSQHYNKNTKEYITLGMFLNSNFKECFSTFCGDDLCQIVIIGNKLDTFKAIGEDKNHYCYISSKNQKFQTHVPGIGMGFTRGEIRFWLDANELFSKSYFGQYDDVYEEGSPFEDMEEKLDIANLEVFGFGDDDTLKELMKKQERDQVIINKMKKVDKSAFVNNDFDREMFFSKTFAHRQDVDEKAYADIKKKDEEMFDKKEE